MHRKTTIHVYALQITCITLEGDSLVRKLSSFSIVLIP